MATENIEHAVPTPIICVGQCKVAKYGHNLHILICALLGFIDWLVNKTYSNYIFHDDLGRFFKSWKIKPKQLQTAQELLQSEEVCHRLSTYLWFYCLQSESTTSALNPQPILLIQMFWGLRCPQPQRTLIPALSSLPHDPIKGPSLTRTLSVFSINLISY